MSNPLFLSVQVHGLMRPRAGQPYLPATVPFGGKLNVIKTRLQKILIISAFVVFRAKRIVWATR